MTQFWRAFSYLTFWSWNLTFLTIVYLGILPILAPAILVDGFLGLVPIDLLLTLALLVLIPSLCALLGGTRFSRAPLQLMQLFYGVEAPLFILCLIRLFLIREVTPASGLILWTSVACIAFFLVELLVGFKSDRPTVGKMQLVGHSLVLWIGLFAGCLFAFYAIPSAWVSFQAFFSFRWLSSFLSLLFEYPFQTIWWVALTFLLFCFTAALFIVLPFALAIFYVRSWHRVMLSSLKHLGRQTTWIGTVGTTGIWAVLFLLLQQQPQAAALEALKTPAMNDQSRQALLTQSETIRKGLLNAYLLSYRYLSTTQENNHIQAMYQSVFDLPEPQARFLQDCYNRLMSPFLYYGSRSDRDQAGTLYEQFFDAPIQKAERKAVQHALESTYNRSEAKAGLISINQETVWVKHRRVTVTEQGDWADIELYEVYENQTNDEQEVFYSFSLPESAVITGLWLGNSDNLKERFPFVVSPRGAAQEVYNREVSRQVDPALLEQVGPRHYRLRAFPVPRQPIGAEKRQRLHLWMTYKVMRQEQGWPMPQLGEKRNAYWTGWTEQVINGKKVRARREEWVPAVLPASNHQPPQLHQVSLSNTHQMMVQPLAEQEYRLPQGKRFAIVLDASRSMGNHRQELANTFRWLSQSLLNANQAELYVIRSQGMKAERLSDPRTFDVSQLTFYGTVQLKEILKQFTELRGRSTYDAILLITDEGSYELSDDAKSLTQMPAPLWMVHVGGQLPPAYDDNTLQAIQGSGGGVATHVDEVMRRIATQANLPPGVVNVVDGYAWLMGQVEKAVSPTQSGFAPIAARQLILGLSRKLEGAGQLTQLDTLHQLAKSYNIVTPYSSMIVLVNDRQKEELKKAEARKDRFEREVETGKEQLTQPGQPFEVSGVPEPEEWLLIGAGVIGIIVVVRYRQTLKTSDSNL